MKKVLIVSYYFPPAGGPGVQRVLKFVKYLRSHGWEPVVLTVEEGAYPNLDPSLAGDVPAGVTVRRTRSWDPFDAYARLTGRKKHEAVTVGFLSDRPPSWQERLSRWIRGNVFLPDARVGWVPHGIRAGLRLAREQGVRAMVTSGPPHSVHLIGRALHRRLGLAWIADFRDPWTEIDFYNELPMSALARKRDARLERSVLAAAGRVTVVSPSMAVKLRAKLDRPYDVIENGFDEADFGAVQPISSSDFVLSHVGNMNRARNPEALWRVLAQLRTAGRVPYLRLQLVGNVDQSVSRSLQGHALDPVVIRVPYVPHHAALGYMTGSALLLSVINRVPGAEGIVTGKLYEYVGSGRPVLGVGPAGGDAARVLRDSGAGQMFDFDDEDGMRGFLVDHYEAWVSGRPLAGASAASARPFSRRGQAGQLAGLLDALVAETPQNPPTAP